MESVDLDSVSRRLQRWWSAGTPGHWQYAAVGVGQLEDGRWFAARIGHRWNGAWVASDERQACFAAQRWMAKRGLGREWAAHVLESVDSA